MPLPGLTVNPVKVAKSKPAAMVELGSARRGEKSGLGLRAEPFDPCARALPNKEEIKEIKKTKAAAASGGRWDAAAAAVQKHFPRTEDQFVARLAETCRGVLVDAGKDPGTLTDEVLADAVRMAHKPGQHSAGLFLKTVPAVLKNWAKAAPARPKNVWDEV
jgi:hypothetical protein